MQSMVTVDNARRDVEFLLGTKISVYRLRTKIPWMAGKRGVTMNLASSDGARNFAAAQAIDVARTLTVISRRRWRTENCR